MNVISKFHCSYFLYIFVTGGTFGLMLQEDRLQSLHNHNVFSSWQHEILLAWFQSELLLDHKEHKLSVLFWRRSSVALALCFRSLQCCACLPVSGCVHLFTDHSVIGCIHPSLRLTNIYLSLLGDNSLLLGLALGSTNSSLDCILSWHAVWIVGNYRFVFF